MPQWKYYHIDKPNTQKGVCTDQEKEKLSKPEFHGKFRFKEIETGSPTKNSVVKSSKKQKQKAAKEETKQD